MKIVSKNYKLEKGVRGYLVYLMDDNNNPIECHDVEGEDKRINKENELSLKYDITEDDVEFVNLDKFKYEINESSEPLYLVFYLKEVIFNDRELVKQYGENIQSYLESRGDNTRLFFIPTTESERIECINPVNISNNDDIKKLEKLVKELELKFDVGVE